MPIHPNMDGASADGAVAGAVNPAHRGELLRLAAAALASVAAIAATVKYGDILAEANSGDSFDVPFQGWQLWLAESAFGLGGLAAIVVAGRWLRGTYRRLHQRSPYGRAIVLAALLPGWFLGGVLALPSLGVLTWASNHTARADAVLEHLMAERRAWLESPTVTLRTKPAPVVLAGTLLRPADLGAGWYDSSRPNPSLTPVRRGPGDEPVDGARSMLTQAHRSGPGWDIGLMVAEQETHFDTGEHAAQYLHHLVMHSRECSCGDELGPVMRSRPHGVTVWRVTSVHPRAHHLWAAFAVGDRVYTVMVFSKEGQPSPRSTLRQPVPLAVAKALRLS